MPVEPDAIKAALGRITDETGFICELLMNCLEWEIPEQAETIPDLGYEWFLEADFGFAAADAGRLTGTRITQIPVSRADDWGVFVLCFPDGRWPERGRGLTGPLRKILRAIVRVKADLPRFRHENTLFICTDAGCRNVTFARFDDIRQKGRVPRLATFGWRNGDKSAVRTLCKHNLPHLHWDEKNWAKAFDIAPVTKAFYQEIFDWFETARAAIRLPLGNAARILERGEDELQAEAVIRLVIRMIFIWFMKEKGGLVPASLFEPDDIAPMLHRFAGGDRDANNAADTDDDAHDYYNAVLQNLFFATLNCPQDKRGFRRDPAGVPRNRHANDRGVATLWRFHAAMARPDELVAHLSHVPFLNGGLFTCHDQVEKFAFGEKSATYHLDGFSENPDNRAQIPDRLFYAADGRSGLIDILKRYHFTIEEHTPLEQEVALDPELLGHVFENLLAAYTPETRETARKQTGSYYTPRNIVDYMVGESLYHTLSRKMGWHEAGDSDSDATENAGPHEHATNRARLRTLLDYGGDHNPFDARISGDLCAALYDVKIFDPACGSGAFPMGALHRLNHILERLNPHESSYRRKLTLITHNIHGVDIQPIATEITAQRFFISLLIEQDANPARPNCGIEPLPNLNLKFMPANTLQSLHWRVEGSRNITGQGDMFYRNVSEQVAIIKNVFADYISATDAAAKDRLHSSFDRHKEALLSEFAAAAIPERDRELFRQWQPFTFSRGGGFFDAQLMFGLTRPDAFDIVIGNPPYVRQEGITDQKPALQAEFADFYKGTADLYTYFYRRGLDLLKPGGVLAYITPNKFMATDYGGKTRQLLTSAAHPLVLIDFNESDVFEAMTEPLVGIFIRGAPKPDATFTSLPEKALAQGDWKDPATTIMDHGFAQPVASLKPEKWLLEKPDILALMQKLTRHATPLGDYVGDKFYRGILTGLNAAFVIDAETRDALIAADPNSADLIKPWLRGRQVAKWHIPMPDQYIINILSSSNHQWPWSNGAEPEKTFARTYPAIYEYLVRDANMLGRLKNRTDMGAHWWEMRACAYHREFSNPKIIYPNMAMEPRFCFDEAGLYANQKCYIIPTADKFLLAALNSRAAAFWCWNALPKLGYRMEFNKVVMRNLPVPRADAAQRAEIAALAQHILDLKSVLPDADTSDAEGKINDHIDNLFALTPTEISLIKDTVR